MMVGRKISLKVRKAHRYLGLFLGIQFLMWTLSGLYFSWTDINKVHGDQFLAHNRESLAFTGLISPNRLLPETEIRSLELRVISNRPYYWIDNTILMDAKTGSLKEGVSQQEAMAIAAENMSPTLKIKGIEKLTKTDKHHEYRGRPLPAYVITYESDENIKAYISITDGSFQSIRHRSWRWFDFLWMTHTMDYEGRDDFNTIALRVFSLLGLITVLSGFVLWYVSSPTIRKILK